MGLGLQSEGRGLGVGFRRGKHGGDLVGAASGDELDQSAYEVPVLLLCHLFMREFV